MNTRLSRRHALRSLGTLVSLPLLECMLPRRALAAAAKPPVRLVWLFAGSGMFMPCYRPALAGRAWAESKEFPNVRNSFGDDKTAGQIKPLATLEPLIPFKEHVSILSGLLHEGAFKRGSIVRHGQDPMCHLTGADLFRVPGVASRNSVSIDGVASRLRGTETRIPALNLTHDRSLTINYSESGSPVPAEWNPFEVFHRLFAGPTAADKAAAAARFQQRKSLLDSVIAQTKSLQATLGVADRERLDEYLTQLREIELRMEQSRKWDDVPVPALPAGANVGTKKIAGVGQSLDLGNPQASAATFGPRIRLLLDVLTLAMQTDQTRIATAILGHMGDVYKEEGIADTYHGYTHTNPVGMAKVDRLRLGHVAYFLGKLQSIREADGSTLLDNSLIHFGGGMGTWHESTDLANLVAGHAGGRLKLGEHIEFKQQPLANLYVLMLQAAGMDVKTFADSTGALSLG